MVNAELDKHPELKTVFDKTNGMLDEVAAEQQVSVEETRALERLRWVSSRPSTAIQRGSSWATHGS